MKRLYNFIAASLSAAILTACSGLPSSPARYTVTVSIPEQLGRASVPLVRLDESSSILYVGNYESDASNVLVFANRGRTLKRTVALPNLFVDGITADARGDLFAASSGYTKPQSLSVFTEEGLKAVKTLQQNNPFYAPTLDVSGNLFASCAKAAANVCEYAAAKRGVVRSRIVRRIDLIPAGLTAELMTTDASGDLAVSDQNHVSVFAPGAKQPYLNLAISPWVGGIAFDQLGNLFVATYSYYQNKISVYAPGDSKPTRSFKIPNGGEQVASILRFDGAGNLYALTPACTSGCRQSPIVTVFAPGGSQPIRTIIKGLENFTGYNSMAVDSAGNVFVSNSGKGSTYGSVVVYGPSRTKPLRVITNGIQHPYYLAVTP